MSEPTPQSLDVAAAVAVLSRLIDAPAGGWPASLSVERVYIAEWDLGDRDGVWVSVVPAEIAESILGRDAVQSDVTVHLAVRKKLAGGKTGGAQTAELDGLRYLTQCIHRHMNWYDPEGLGLSWWQTTNKPAFVPEHIHQLRQYTSVLSVSYRGARREQR